MLSVFYGLGLKALVLVMVLSGQAKAADRISVKLDGDVKINASVLGLTRVSVTDDRIKSLVSDAEASKFQITNDPETGDIFLKYVGEEDKYVGESGYLITDAGATIGFLIQPIRKRAESVLITITGRKTAKLAANEEEEGFIGAGGGFSDFAADNWVSSLTGFTRETIAKTITKNKPTSGRDGAFIRSHKGGPFVGELRVASAGKSSKLLREQDYYRDGVVAIWLQARSLAAGERAWVVVITKARG